MFIKGVRRLNRTRKFFMMVSLTILFVVFGGAVGGSRGASAAFLAAAAMNFVSYWFNDKMILLQNGKITQNVPLASRIAEIIYVVISTGARNLGFQDDENSPSGRNDRVCNWSFCKRFECEHIRHFSLSTICRREPESPPACTG